MKKRAVIIFAILLLAVGFAAISTTLIINGDTKVSENTDDFSVIFSAAILDGEDVYNEVINDTKQTINFSTSELKTKNQTSILNYEVTNNSSNYDAEITVNCKIKDNAEAKYTSIKNELEGNAAIVKAKEKLNGTLTVTLEKTATEEVREEYVCELTFNAVERDTLGRIYSGPTKWAFDFTGEEQIFTVPISGTYKIETWGAQGGNNGQSITTKFAYTKDYLGGYGGFSKGEKHLNAGTILYLNVGGQGEEASFKNRKSVGGYNGGGSGGVGPYNYWINSRKESNPISSAGGGGATHVATKSGLLSTLSNSINQILIVAGGGGGATPCPYNLNVAGTGGGISGGLGYVYSNIFVNGGTQTEGYAFGQGQDGHDSIQGTSGDAEGSGGGGGGFYGGYSYQGTETKSDAAGAGGSGYIGNSLLIEKSMYCYNCTESTEESTKTISTTCANETPTENCAKSGNGYARISLIK